MWTPLTYPGGSPASTRPEGSPARPGSGRTRLQFHCRLGKSVKTRPAPGHTFHGTASCTESRCCPRWPQRPCLSSAPTSLPWPKGVSQVFNTQTVRTAELSLPAGTANPTFSTTPLLLTHCEQRHTWSWKGMAVFFAPHPFEEAKILPFKALLLLSEMKRRKHWLYQSTLYKNVFGQSIPETDTVEKLTAYVKWLRKFQKAGVSHRASQPGVAPPPPESSVNSRAALQSEQGSPLLPFPRLQSCSFEFPPFPPLLNQLLINP